MFRGKVGRPRPTPMQASQALASLHGRGQAPMARPAMQSQGAPTSAQSPLGSRGNPSAQPDFGNLGPPRPNYANSGAPNVGGRMPPGRMNKGGYVKKMAAGGSASKRADGCAARGKTKGKFI